MEPWTIVLAGGEGTRLTEVARRRYGYARPKQFCAFGGPRSLLEETVDRASSVSPADRIVVVTTRRWESEAERCLRGAPPVRHVQQPCGKDTAPGVLLPLVEVLRHDPEGIVVVMPSDHHVQDSSTFADAVRRCADHVRRVEPRVVVALGAEVNAFEDGYGWIVPSRPEPFSPVERFVEKPTEEEAQAALGQGALVNTFVLVARARTFAWLFARFLPRWWHSLQQEAEVDAAYQLLPPANFSVDILARAAHLLRVYPLPPVGWSDIGTPERLERVERGLAPTVG